jgi:hypothetical protein
MPDYLVRKIEQPDLIMQIHACDIGTNAKSFASEKVYRVIFFTGYP